MCGIAGLWYFQEPQTSARVLVGRMIESLRHRGPDHQGIWGNDRIGLAHSLLAIVDVSPASYQPMMSADGRYVLIFNGEIYNYKTLAQSLQKDGHACECHNDTQVLLHACIHWGIAQTLPKLNGMFAFAFYDQANDCLTLARDRFGEKPLYYAHEPRQFLAFASELKALCTLPFLKKECDETALRLYLQSNYVPCPYSIYKGIRKLFPGHYATIRNGQWQESVYFDLETALSNRSLLQSSPQAVIEQLDQQLQQSVAERMVADVPVGAFLSGGIDSSLVVALMQRQSTQPVKTFTVGYRNPRWDESRYAEPIARYLHTDHTTLYFQTDELLQAIASISHIYDEPFADPAALPTYLMSLKAKQSVTVALTGDGGDELFAGYYKHKWVPKLYRWGQWIPNALLNTLRRLTNAWIAPVCPKLARRWDRIDAILSQKNFLEAYQQINQEWAVPGSWAGTWRTLHPTLQNLTEQVLYLDLRTQFTDEFLCKCDRASMAAGLETRNPMIDYALVDFALSIPIDLKLWKGIKKYLLKTVLSRYLPRELWERPKSGFQMPLADLFRKELKSTMEAYLKADTCLWKFLNPAVVQSIWLQHLSGKITHEILLWNFFVAQKFLLNG